MLPEHSSVAADVALWLSERKDALADRGEVQVYEHASVCLDAIEQAIPRQPREVTVYLSATIASLLLELEEWTGGSDTRLQGLALLVGLFLRHVPLTATPSLAATEGSLFEAMEKVRSKQEGAREKTILLGVLTRLLECLAAMYDVLHAHGSHNQPRAGPLKTLLSVLFEAGEESRVAALKCVVALCRFEQQSGHELAGFTPHLGSLVFSDRTQSDPVTKRTAIRLLRSLLPFIPVKTFREVVDDVIIRMAKGVAGATSEAANGLRLITEYLAPQESDPSPFASSRVEADDLFFFANRLAVERDSLNLKDIGISSAFIEVSGNVIAAMCEQGRTTNDLLYDWWSFSKRRLEEGEPLLTYTITKAMGKVVSCAVAHDVEDFPRLVKECRSLLEYRLKGVWPSVFPVITELFTAIEQRGLEFLLQQYSQRQAAMIDKEDDELTDQVIEDFRSFCRLRLHPCRGLLEDLASIMKRAVEPLDHSATLATSSRRGVEDALGAAAVAFSAALPEVLKLPFFELRLDSVPITDPEFSTKANSWLLPVLKRAVKRTSLVYFQNELLPLACQLQQHASKLQNEHSQDITAAASAKKYQLLADQIWSLLPAFFTEPIDLSAVFPDAPQSSPLANTMLSFLDTQPSLRHLICSALTTICEQSNLEHGASGTGGEAVVLKTSQSLIWLTSKRNHRSLRCYSERFLPLLFTTLLKQEAEVGSLKAIQALAHFCPGNVLDSYLKNICRKLLKASLAEPGGDGRSREPHNVVVLESAGGMVALAELANALVPALPAETLPILLRVMCPLLVSEETTVAKEGGGRKGSVQLSRRAYKAVRSVIERELNESLDKSAFLPKTPLHTIEGCKKLWEHLQKARQGCGPGALKSRLSCIKVYCRLLSLRQGSQGVWRSHFHDVSACLVPETLMCCKSTNQAVRADALEILRLLAASSGDVSDIVAMISAGLASTSSPMKAAAVLALTQLLLSHGLADTEPFRRVVRIVLLLLGDGDKSVFEASLRFAKACVRILSLEAVTENLPLILEMLNNSHAIRYRILLHRVIEKMLKRLGPDSLAAAFPADKKDLLSYCEKRMRRSKHATALKRKRRVLAHMHGGVSDEAESDSESEDIGRQKDADFRIEEGVPSLQNLLDDFEMEDGPSRKRSRASGTLQLREELDDETIDLFATSAKQASIRPESSKQRKTEKKVLEAFEPRGQIFGSSRGRTISSKETDDRQPTKKGRTGLQSYAYMRIGKKSSQGRGAKRHIAKTLRLSRKKERRR
ncbi:unnamed protein product [Vitrella brassicaformis CCMP3155]|uniref:RRP12 HEAT domain-containing protein n=1 Tax=Vitrella brassicaformis (strain CCMP3155) TaxID=1169540 RepID=A0A0G4FXU3_VITBC|nr:unnamed protein product [Vitrella brassicaformis CCMP3155]|eukprot:CEM19688.1 unnamed protein product [Vitrella brassicaformis CCMP3155]